MESKLIRLTFKTLESFQLWKVLLESYSRYDTDSCKAHRLGLLQQITPCFYEAQMQHHVE